MMVKQAAGAPAFPKISHKHDTRMHSLMGEQMFLVPKALTVQEAQGFIDAAESLGFQQQGSGGAAAGEAFRDNGRVQVEGPQLAELLWQRTGLQRLFDGLSVEGATAVGLNSNLRFYRYVSGQKFGKHIDDSNDLGQGRFTLYTLLIYLSGSQVSSSGSSSASSCGGGSRAGSVAKKGGAAAASKASSSRAATISKAAIQDLQGGETVFYGNRGRVLASVQPQPGLALLHLHGEERCLEHEALEVRAGTKYVLRSDVVFSSSGV